MEKKKATKKTNIASKKKTVKKVTTKKKVTRTKKNKKKAFTLIELLAVIIILGVLMVIAIPAVTSYIQNSRKSSYVATAHNVVAGARTKVNEGILGMYDTDTTYYIPHDMIKGENEFKSPYGDFEEAYVVVIFNGTNYDYYWTSMDTTNTGMYLTYNDSLDIDRIVTDMEGVSTDIGVGNRSKIIVFNEDGTIKEEKEPGEIIEDKASAIKHELIETIEQKTEGELSVGDEIVLGGKEHFFVIASDSEKTTLIAKYNLYVGYNVKEKTSGGSGTILDGEISTSDSRYGWQSAETEYNTNIALVPFSGKKYWQSTTNESLFDPKYPDARDESVYDADLSSVAPVVSNTTNKSGYSVPKVEEGNYSISYYVEPYIARLRSMGVYIYEGNVISHEQAVSIGCGYNRSCDNSISWIKRTKFWTGSVAWMGQAKIQLQIIYILGGYYFNEYNAVTCGVRPTITMRTSDIPLLGHEYFASKEIPYDR